MELLTVPKEIVDGLSWPEIAWNATEHSTVHCIVPTTKNFPAQREYSSPSVGAGDPSVSILTLKKYFSDIFSTNSRSSLKVLVLLTNFR